MQRNRPKNGRRRRNRRKKNKPKGEMKSYQRNANNAFRNNGPSSITMPRGLICPDRMVVNLMWVDVNHSAINSAGNKVASYRYRPTAAYDVDPTIGGTTISGFDEWTSFYNYYRVLAYKVEFFVENAETFAITVIDLPMNTDPGAAPTLASVESYFMNPYNRVRTISAKTGKDSCRISRSIDCRKFVGSSTQRFDDSYASLVTTVPINNIYHILSIWSGANNLVNGVYYTARIALTVEFYDRAILAA